MNAVTTQPWYNKRPLVIILLIVFAPAGLYALWKSSSFNKIGKSALSLATVLLIVAAFNSTMPAKAAIERDPTKPLSFKEMIVGSKWIAVDSINPGYNTTIDSTDKNGVRYFDVIHHKSPLILDFTEDKATLEAVKLQATFELAGIVHMRGTSIAGNTPPKFSWSYDLYRNEKKITLNGGFLQEDIEVEYKDDKLYWKQKYDDKKIVFVRRQQ